MPKKQEQILIKTLTVPSSSCPLHICDGDGYIIKLWLIDGKEVETAEPCKCRVISQYQNGELATGIPTDFVNCKIKDFVVDLYEDRQKAIIAKRAAVNYINNFDTFFEKGKGLYLYSSTKGSGKTRLACSIGNALLSIKGLSVKFIMTVNLLESIRNTYNNQEESTKQVIDRYKSVGVLILDDIGAEKISDWVNEIFLNILDYRLANKKPVIFTSNFPIARLNLDERIINRIFKMAIELQLPEESIRYKNAKAENKDLEKILFS